MPHWSKSWRTRRSSRAVRTRLIKAAQQHLKALELEMSTAFARWEELEALRADNE